MQYLKLLDFLEEELSEYKVDIKKHNKHCVGASKDAFLCNTYTYKKIGESKYIFTTFENDLPPIYRDMILDKIKQYMTENNIDVEYNTRINFN